MANYADYIILEMTSLKNTRSVVFTNRGERPEDTGEYITVDNGELWCTVKIDTRKKTGDKWIVAGRCRVLSNSTSRKYFSLDEGTQITLYRG